MKIKHLAKTICVCLIFSLGMSSCAKWLEVEMEDQVMEKNLFKNYEGYLTALNGVYLTMNSLYGKNLSTGAIDVMAQYYNVTENNNHTMKLYAGYKYQDAAFESFNDAVWSKAYNLLAHVNAILEHCTDDAPLTPQQLGVIRGECYALRAFLHFDLLRLYGPIYSEDPTAISIPYQGSSKRVITPMLPANEVLDYIIADLNKAEADLKDHDPILTKGVGNVTVIDNGVSSYDMMFRQLRMNYYAVQLMLARAYHWKGDRATAYDIAVNKIIKPAQDEKLVVFPWATKAQVEAGSKPDYLFSSEVIFSLYHSKRTEEVFESTFSGKLSMSARLTFIGENVASNSKVANMYDDEGDLRKKMWKVVAPSDAEIKNAAENGTEAKTTLGLNKFAEVEKDATLDGTELYRWMLPLMRLSEAYLIAAETAVDTEEALGYINAIRRQRECRDVTAEEDFNKLLTYEMAREVIGEGQLFFFYKRRGAEKLIPGTKLEGDYNMVKGNYVLPIPKSETDKRANIKQ